VIALSEGKARRGVLKNDRQVRRCDYVILRGEPRLVVALYPFDDAASRADLAAVLS
jgi:hypothetical protein